MSGDDKLFRLDYSAGRLHDFLRRVVCRRRHLPGRRRPDARTNGTPGAVPQARSRPHHRLLLLSAAAILTFTFDGTGTTPITAPSWAIALQFGLGVAGLILVIVGGRAYKRAADAYPPGKHADPETPPDGRRRWRLFRDYR
jgi:hypothetical protein